MSGQCLFCYGLGLASVLSAIGFAQEAEEESIAPAKTSKGDVISPKGRPKELDVVGGSSRYIVWNDSQGWHFRTASRGVKPYITFSGKLELTDGEFGKFRGVGIDRSAKSTSQDIWAMDEARQKLEFKFITASGPDGFDFEVIKGKDAELKFDLKIDTVADKDVPKRIYIGKESVKPTKRRFSLPAQP